ncbi:endonuclease domain-containing protein [Brevundimonas balnearis]|uniref:Endonuclease domain-containing protein n=1 Tax=Brevundimonas balnearis TaxID=1572858 RepID=A0ABV6R082_9CAUL
MDQVDPTAFCPSTPLPLEGEGVGGWGGVTGGSIEPPKTRSESPGNASKRPASTPSQPSPLEGEGLLTSRFARTPKIKSGGVKRTRRLRAEPTLAEARLWEHLRLFEVRFRREAPIGPYVVDFACHRARLIIEVDGGVHAREDVALRDYERQFWLEGQGYRVLRFTNDQVLLQPEIVLDTIRSAHPLLSERT